MDKTRSPESIKLAYRAIKKNSGSHTFRTDKKNIEYLAQMSEEEYVKFIQSLMNNYYPKKVKRVETPEPDGKTRPLGIPCIQDIGSFSNVYCRYSNRYVSQNFARNRTDSDQIEVQKMR